MKNNEGHRERLRQRFLMSGLSGFQDYEILELLLTYVIVRKDCKEIAKELLKKYGDLYTLLQQSNTELRENKYITERIAIFFKVLFSIIEKQLYLKMDAAIDQRIADIETNAETSIFGKEFKQKAAEYKKLKEELAKEIKKEQQTLENFELLKSLRN